MSVQVLTPKFQCVDRLVMPTGLQANLEKRKALWEAGEGSADAAHEIWIACSRDIRFYVNAFCWGYNPREHDPRKAATPFILYPFQDEELLKIQDALGSHDHCIEKSRDLGLTYLCLFGIEHRWHFFPLQTFLLMSHKQEKVDTAGGGEGRGNPGSLFWKLDFQHRMQPDWLVPVRTRTFKRLYNQQRESTIFGESTTSKAAIGERYTGILMDEMDLWEDAYDILQGTTDVTECRIYLSAHYNGTATAFYEQTQKCESRSKLLWWMHPEKAKGLKRDANGKLTSPWYEARKKRAVTSQEMAQQVDCDVLAGTFQFFLPGIIETQKKYTQHPKCRGFLTYDPVSLEPTGITQHENGNVQCWGDINPANRDFTYPKRRYVVACDIGYGTGASESTACAIDTTTGEQVLMMASTEIGPSDWAKMSIALAKWLQNANGDGAYLIWESNGPGSIMVDIVKLAKYWNCYFRRDEKRRGIHTTDVYGFYSLADNKRNLLEQFGRAMRDERIKIHDARILEQCQEYIIKATGEVVHSRSESKVDPTATKQSHADRVIAAALAMYVIAEKPEEGDEKPQEIPANCFQRRYDAWRRDQKRVGQW